MADRLPIPLANYGAVCWRNAAAQLLYLCPLLTKSLADTDRDAMHYLLDAFGPAQGYDASMIFLTEIMQKLPAASKQLFEIIKNDTLICGCGAQVVKPQPPAYFDTWPVVGFFDMKYSCDACRAKGIYEAAAKHYVSVLRLPQYLIINDMTDLRDTIIFKNVPGRDGGLQDIKYELLGYIVYTGSHYYTIGRIGNKVYQLNDSSVAELPQMPREHQNTTTYLYSYKK